MAYHCYFDANCPDCGDTYVRFDESERCPGCGSVAAPVHDLAGEVVHYARLTLIDQGHLEVGGYQPTTPADLYVLLGYDVLEAARRLPQLEAALIAAEAVEPWRATWPEARCEHFRRFFAALLARWQLERHRPPAVAQPAPAAADESAAESLPRVSRTFKKKWQPKEF